MLPFEVVGHRGAAGYEPENTLRSFRRAIELGAGWIELDVRMSKDGVLMVMHDETVDRTTDGTGEVAELTLNELKRLDAGKGEKIPMLQEVIDLAKGKAKVDIEIKSKGIEPDVVDMIEKNGIVRKCMVSSFKADIIKKVKELNEDVKTAIITSKVPEDVVKYIGSIVKETGTDAIMASKKVTDGRLVGVAHKKGLEVGIWNADTPDEIRLYADMGPDYLCSNYPDLIWKHSILSRPA
jgi:glycerophosphoryl diester phosphodiesterase